ncbi:FAD-dependent oxidoreductase [Paracoccus suum]|uniref:FAD-dependent oxidoreductase n=1 Tax=Paracoccus suum TaxID=2259340 RepID=A0A344PID4_9RHOB|nr:FAD-dependent oxidoreductase [Paracoccus suum]AXC49139.1 FAD-dependent oxidoreductase [Paracoccus suum]
MSSDVTVVGAGIFGLSCAWAMARRGARVQVLEAAAIGAGASGGMVGALAPHAPENWTETKQIQLESLVAAEPFWADVAAVGGIDPGYARSGRLQPVTDPTRAAALIAGAARHWPGYSMTLVEGPAGLAPGGPWLRDDLTARIAPRRALAALAAALRAQGATLTEGCGPVLAADGPAIWATGAPGLVALGQALGRAVGSGVKGQSALLEFDAATCPQIYAPGLHIVPHGDGTVAIGSTSESAFTQPGPDALLDDVIARARALIPPLGAAPVIDRWAGIRPRARSRGPLVAPWPDRPGQLIVNGGFKIGFGVAPWIAEAVADLLLEGHSRIPPAWQVV